MAVVPVKVVEFAENIQVCGELRTHLGHQEGPPKRMAGVRVVLDGEVVRIFDPNATPPVETLVHLGQCKRVVLDASHRVPHAKS